MKIKGRGQFVGTLIATDDGITIRVDDQKDDAFWLEIEVSLEDLLQASVDMLNMNIPSVPCPVCGGPARRPAFSQQIEPLNAWMSCARCRSNLARFVSELN